MKLIIGNKNYSSWSLRPWLLMDHFKLNFEEQRITLFTPDMREQMDGICPNYKVPALIDSKGDSENGATTSEPIHVWDSLAICEYINDEYLQGKAWPSNSKQRATARSIVAEMHSGFMHLRNRLHMNCRRTPSKVSLSPEVQNDINRIIDIWQSCLNDPSRKGEFLFGEFSIVDAMYMPVVSRFSTYKIDVPADVEAYMHTMLNLPSYQSWAQAGINETEVVVEDEVPFEALN